MSINQFRHCSNLLLETCLVETFGFPQRTWIYTKFKSVTKNNKLRTGCHLLIQNKKLKKKTEEREREKTWGWSMQNIAA